MILGEVCALSLVYIYIAVCWFCTVRCPLLFASTCICHFLITRLMLLYILFMFVFVLLCLFCILCILCFFIVLCTLSSFVYNCLFPIFVQVYRSLPPGGKQIAVNKYHILLFNTANCIRIH